MPPHPSLAPHALFVQLGAQPHTPLVPPPPHTSGAVHVPPEQQGCSLPPHAPQSPPQVVPAGHTMHRPPPLPHAISLVPIAHVPALQHPEQELVSHTHPPFAQCSPAAQVPVWQIPPHPSLAPQALAVQLGVQPHSPS
jgi:hypothetical protein